MTPPPIASNRRLRSEKMGRIAEWVAVCHLWLSGHRLVYRRYKTPVGEIDLVTRRGDTVHLIEVKYRPDHDAGLAAVSDRARHRIRRAAEWFLTAHPVWRKDTLSFDVMTVTPRGIRYHPNVF